jgi:hypothetical protein
MSLVLIMGILAFACNPPRHASSINHPEKVHAEGPGILFLNYVISRDSATSTYSALLIHMVLRDGTIKENNAPAAQGKENDLKLLVLDQDQRPLSYQIIPNPLDKSVEYVNDARQLERKMIHLDSAQVHVRLQLEPGASSIVLKQIVGDNHEESLLLKTSIR